MSGAARYVYYEYDDADRLIGERTPHHRWTWQYDPVGNRTYEHHTHVVGIYGYRYDTYYTYDAANELEHTHKQTEASIYYDPYERTADQHVYYTYDPRGNCTRVDEADGSTYFEYNHANFATAIRYRDGSTQYFNYDGLLRMYAMDDDGTMTYFTWDSNGLNPLAERDANGTVVAEYTHGHVSVPGAGSLVAAKKQAYGATYYHYPAHNHHGDAFVQTDETGAIAQSTRFNAWGQVTHERASGPSTRFTWQSNWIRLRDGLYKSPVRLYSADMGRFLSRDPMQGPPRSVAVVIGYSAPTVMALRERLDNAARRSDTFSVHSGMRELVWITSAAGQE